MRSKLLKVLLLLRKPYFIGVDHQSVLLDAGFDDGHGTRALQGAQVLVVGDEVVGAVTTNRRALDHSGVQLLI